MKKEHEMIALNCQHHVGSLLRRVVSVFGMIACVSASAAPAVFNATESAKASDVIGLQGANYGSSPSVLIATVDSSGNVGASTALTLLSSTSIYVTAQIPSTLALGLYEVWVKDSNGNQSLPSFINRARITSFEYPEVEPGSQFRLFGRNLVMTGGTSNVRFVDTSTQVSYSGTVIAGGDNYVVTVQAPASLVSGHTYTIYYKNGLGGPAGEVAAPVVLTVRTGGTDSFGLNVPWGADYAPFATNSYNVKTDVRLTNHAVGDGVTDDTAAIQAAIDVANAAGGGIVYFPAGTYRVATLGGQGGGVGLTLKSKVVLQGAGQSASTIAIAGSTSVTTTTGMIFVAPASSLVGMGDLTISCTTHASANSVLYPLFSTNTDTSRVFLLRTTFDGGYWAQGGVRLSGSSVNRCLISNCTIKNLRRNGRPFMTKDYGSNLAQTAYVYIRSNSIPNFNIGPQLGSQNLIYEGNDLVFDGDYYNYVVNTLGQDSATYPDAGSQNRINISGPNLVILSNTFSHAGAAFVNQNDGENILAEDNCMGGVPSDLGTATSGGSNTLSDSTKAWTSNLYVGVNVLLVDGMGAGQVRTVTANTATSVTVDTPWLVAPDSTTKYAIIRVNVPHLLIKRNTMEDKEHTLMLFSGAYDAAVVQNTSTNSGDICVRSHIQPGTTVMGTNLVQIVSNVLVADNQVTATSSTKPSFIDIDSSYQYSDPRFGTGMFLTEVRRNNVTALGLEAFTATTTFSINGFAAWHPQGDTPPFAAEGVIFDGNTAADATTAYGWVPGVDGITVTSYTNQDISRTTYDLTHCDGILTGGVTWSGTGTTCYDGTGYIDLGYMTTPTAMTIEGRFKTVGTYATVLSNQPIGSAVVFITTTGKLCVQDGGVKLITSSAYNDGLWHHFAWTSDGSISNIYVDGALKLTGTQTRASNAGLARIGHDCNNGYGPYVGELDEIRVWNGVRPGSDILKYKDTELAGDEPGLIQYWRFSEGSGSVAKNGVLSGDISDSLVASWRLDEGSGTTASDATGNGNTGTSVGSIPTWVPGVFGSAIHLDGSNYVSVPDKQSLQGTSAFTVHARVKIDSISTVWGKNWRGIVTKGQFSTSPYAGWEIGTYAQSDSPTSVGFYFRRQAGANQVTVSGTRNLVVGRYYAVAGTWDIATHTIALYVDGQLQGTIKNYGDMTPSTAELTIGKLIGWSNFVGSIDDVRVFDRALSALDIAALHTQ